MRALRYLLIGLVGVTVILAALLYFAVPPYLKAAPNLRVAAEETTQSGEEIFAWIADITQFGWRDPGGEGGAEDSGLPRAPVPELRPGGG